MARLSNLQMRALNDSMSNLLNTGLEQIHKRLDELQTNPQTRSQTGARRDQPRRHSRSDHDIHEEESHDDDDKSINRPRRGPRNQNQGDVNPFGTNDRADNGLGGLKLKISSFDGKNDPNAFLECERKIELYFDCQNFSDLRKEGAGERPIDTWAELTMLMRRRFVPDHYHRDLQHKLRRLLQGTKSVEDYHQEMEILMIKADVDEPLDATMDRFLTGLNRDIQDRMELQEYDNMEQMLHKAILIEQQVKRKGLSRPSFAPKPSFSSKANYQDKGKSSSTTNTAFKTTAPAHVDREKKEEASKGTRDIQCFRCHGLGHYANRCPNQKVMVLLENGEVESEDDKEDLGPVFDDDNEALHYPAHGPLLVAIKPLDDAFGPIFDEEVDGVIDEFCLTFLEDSGPIFDEDHLEYPVHGPLLVIRRALSVQPKTNCKEQRENLFHSRCLISEKVCSLIIYGGSCTNVSSDTLVKKLGLVTWPLSQPFRLEWLNEAGEQYVKEQVTVPFTIGRYEDEVVCNVLPMDACHILSGRPWQFDKRAVYDGFTNRHSFDHKGKKITLVPLTPLEVHQDQVKLKRGRDKEPKTDKPETSTKNSNFFIKESQVRKSLYSQKPFLLLVYKESLMALSSSDLAPEIPSELLAVL
ncbi:PREDICTED: uncharacterized protein LOC106344830 [Brassica oleracea var. oleracea]|uniref:uncharacterized protein LOC106344830 n=1 Tax=Brassica oleracea var. oleracea TaxID=109376 RepID=UPI0006A6A6E7|nr:PREDICTED: uncharacterized protein LOC106344830 [Brassica oleracea var. oleracea]